MAQREKAVQGPAAKRGRGTRTQSAPDEWVGGCAEAPFLVGEGSAARQLIFVCWIEASTGCIVGHDIHELAEVHGALGRVLFAALKNPLVGEPRWPTSLRVGTELLAEDLQRTIGDTLPIRVAPTPEIDHALDDMAVWMSNRNH